MPIPPRFLVVSSLGLVSTDGTVAGTQVIAPTSNDFMPEARLGVLGGEVLFPAHANTADTGATTLWASDGTTAGTHAIVTLPDHSTPGYSSTDVPFELSPLLDRLYFEYSDGSQPGYDQRTWSTDGTVSDTAPVDSTLEGILSAVPVSRGYVFLGQGGLFETDGTAPGTVLVKPGVSAVGGALPTDGLASLAGRAVFAVTSASAVRPSTGSTNQLWITDGTAADTHLVATLPDHSPFGSGQAQIRQFVTFGDRVLFTYEDGAGNTDLWATDGTASGTVELPNTASPTIGDGEAAIAGGRYVFMSPTLGLVATDGTPGGTSVIKPRVEGAGGFAPTPSMASLGNEAVFAASSNAGPNNNGTPDELWITDGTAAGTKLVTTLPGTISDLSTPMVSLGNEVLFDYSDGTTSYQLWATNGTAAGTHALPAGADALPNGGAILGGPQTTPIVAVADTTSGAHAVQAAATYGGPASFLQSEFFYAGTGSATLLASTPSMFLVGGPGSDALQATSGDNVLDGAGGSNFYVGGPGHDTFFVNLAAGGPIWDTVVNAHAGDTITLWGFQPGVSRVTWQDGLGAPGYTGATLQVDPDGSGRTLASITIAGISVAQAQGYAERTGTIGSLPYLTITPS